MGEDERGGEGARELDDGDMEGVTGGTLPASVVCPSCGYRNNTYGLGVTCASCGLKYNVKDKRW
ncbi:MAG: hypothetical protein FWC23_03150 [Chitinispirillia bacterium]|nr:hypothetical protein [Chitinispirillia bacterium]MCL2268172.1 hypothetical protein [Chitinispirillia bacterium]